jgi:hypothetical protein
MASTQDRYMEILMGQIRDIEYPSTEMLDRIESNLSTREQLQEYLEILFERVESCQYPSKQLLDRLERLSPLL